MCLGFLSGTKSSRQECSMYVVWNSYPPKQDDCMQTASWGGSLACASSSAVMASCWEDAVGLGQTGAGTILIGVERCIAVPETCPLTADLLAQVHPSIYKIHSINVTVILILLWSDCEHFQARTIPFWIGRRTQNIISSCMVYIDNQSLTSLCSLRWGMNNDLGLTFYH